MHFKVILNSMHRYQPRLHVIHINASGLDDKSTQNFKTFSFTETQFTAVTAYQTHRVSRMRDSEVETRVGGVFDMNGDAGAHVTISCLELPRFMDRSLETTQIVASNSGDGHPRAGNHCAISPNIYVTFVLDDREARKTIISISLLFWQKKNQCLCSVTFMGAKELCDAHNSLRVAAVSSLPRVTSQKSSEKNSGQ